MNIVWWFQPASQQPLQQHITLFVTMMQKVFALPHIGLESLIQFNFFGPKNKTETETSPDVF